MVAAAVLATIKFPDQIIAAAMAKPIPITVFLLIDSAIKIVRAVCVFKIWLQFAVILCKYHRNRLKQINYTGKLILPILTLGKLLPKKVVPPHKVSLARMANKTASLASGLIPKLLVVLKVIVGNCC